MRKFELNKTNKKIEPTKEQINRQKDFARLHHQYEQLTKRGKKPLYRDWKRLLFWTMIGVIVYLIFSEL
jgi:hypothetical protein